VNLSDVRAVIFDMDGLLVDSERLARTALVETAQAFGITPDPQTFTRMIGLPEDGSLELLRTRYGRGFPSDRFILEAARRCAALVSSGALELKAGAAELVACLERSRVPKAIATSSSRAKAKHTLTNVCMLKHFQAIVTRTDVQRGKPHPDLFVRAASELGVALNHCLALEDSYNGVRAAHAAGMRVIMVPDLLFSTDEMQRLSEGIFTDLFAVLDALIGSGVIPAHCRTGMAMQRV
jgi:beta-phosphoglucomutase-like phosphatase (HAD superfamily)